MVSWAKDSASAPIVELFAWTPPFMPYYWSRACFICILNRSNKSIDKPWTLLQWMDHTTTCFLLQRTNHHLASFCELMFKWLNNIILVYCPLTWKLYTSVLFMCCHLWQHPNYCLNTHTIPPSTSIEAIGKSECVECATEIYSVFFSWC